MRRPRSKPESIMDRLRVLAGITRSGRPNRRRDSQCIEWRNVRARSARLRRRIDAQRREPNIRARVLFAGLRLGAERRSALLQQCRSGQGRGHARTSPVGRGQQVHQEKRTQHGKPQGVPDDGQPDIREGGSGRSGATEWYGLCRARRPLGPEAKQLPHDMAGYKVAILHVVEDESHCNLGRVHIREGAFFRD
jgi:hypothetical protein